MTRILEKLGDVERIGALLRGIPACAVGLLVVTAGAWAGPRICANPTGRPLPEYVSNARNMPDPIEIKGGFEELVETLRQNRIDLAAGRISAQTAELRGGTRIGGSKEVPVLAFKYSDTGTDPLAVSDLDDQLFGSWPTGTMTDYYDEISYGALNVTGTVFDWVEVSRTGSYYTNGCSGICADAEMGELLEEVLDLNDAAIDFGDYDNDGPDGIPNSGDDDGFVDFAAFVHPDVGAECTGSGDQIWSHRWVVRGWNGTSYETDDDADGGGKIRIDNYVVMPIFDCGGTDMIEIGVFCHEFGHAFGLPDFYDTDTSDGDSEGIGHWGLMGAGNWNSPESPAHMCAFSKERLGWLSYFNVTTDIEDFCLPPVENVGVAARFWTSGGAGPEYFVAENRQRIGFDSELDGTGLVIYHIDEDLYSGDVNDDETHKAVDVECADATSAGHVANADDLDANVNRSDSGDVWCPSTQDTFDDSSVPDTRSYSGVDTGVAVRNIDSCGSGDVCADYVVGVTSSANVCIHDCSADGCAEITSCGNWFSSPDIWIDNDDDGIDDYPAAGIENHLWFRVENTGSEVLSDVQVQLYYGDPAAGQLWPSTATELIGTGEIAILDVGEVYEDYVVFEYPSPPARVDHYCIGAIAVHDLDPQNAESPPLDNNVAQVNHQVLVARPDGTVASGGACPGPISEVSRIKLLPGSLTAPVLAEVRVGTPPTFSDVSIPPHWSYDIAPSTGPFIMAPGMERVINVFVTSNNADDFDFARLPITLWDLDHNEAIGGVILEYEIDCHDARKPLDIKAQWTDPQPDDLDLRTVLVEWPKVRLDQAGGNEIVEHYEVWRADDSPTPEALVARVAVDAEPNEGGFQWYDRVPRDCDITYVYRVRAVDAAGYAGVFSDPGATVCPITDVEFEGDSLADVSTSWPNPFRTSTTVRFELNRSGPVDVAVYDVQGHKLRQLLQEERNAGVLELAWDGRDDSGRPVASGTYFVRLVGEQLDIKERLVLTR